jgi:hypothetical protein
VKRVVITGIGALSPLGATPRALWAGLLEGKGCSKASQASRRGRGCAAT